MNFRKFCFNLTLIVLAVLLCSGAGILYYTSSHYVDTSADLSDESNPINPIFEPFLKSKEPFNILVLGGDKVAHNSDTMMLVNFDPATVKVNIMSIPRDTKVTIENKTRKINYAFPHGGIDLAVQTVSELLDVNIKYYVFVDTSAFVKIIDLLGGVDYYIPADMDYDDPTQNLHIHLKKGQQTLDGKKAEQFVRFRHPNKWTKELRQYYDGSDLKRTEAQQNFLKELMRQKLNIQYLPKLNSIINVAFESVETNFTLSEIVKLTGYISKFKIDNVTFIPMPGKEYGASPWYWLCDVPATRKIMAESFKGTGTFVNVDVKKVTAYEKEKMVTAAEASKSNTSNNKDVTKNNPSNDKTNIEGKDKDDP